MSRPNETDVAVVGAGPYGLSLSAHLRARGVRHRIFGRPMDAWRRNMPRDMFLKSPGRASNLSEPGGEHTLEAFCRAMGEAYSDDDDPVGAELFTRYGEWFQKALVPALDTRQVLSCDADADGFRLEIEGGETLAAKSVVAATGFAASRRMPEELIGLPPQLVSHTSAHSSFEAFRGQDVTVLGAGQSALETAALLKESGARPTLVARRDRIEWGEPPKPRTLYQRLRRPTTALSVGWRFVFFEHPTLPFHYLPLARRREIVDTILGPLGAWWLRDRVDGEIPLLLGRQLIQAQAGSNEVILRLRHGNQISELRADHVVAGTGYRVTPASFGFLSERLRRSVRCEHGSPVLSMHFESSAPGLHFIGLASAYSFGPAMRFVAGAHATAPRVSGYLAARHGRGAEPSRPA